MTANKRVWVEITVETTAAAMELVGELLAECGCTGVVYHDPRLFTELEGKPAELLPDVQPEDQAYRVAGYLAMEPGWEDQVMKLRTRIEEVRAFLPVGSGSVTFRQLHEEDWANAWKEYYRPERIGPFLIIPSWLSPPVLADAIPIRLDPGMAFGTGAHPTTQLCLAMLPTVVRPGHLVYDIGTGSGILAIAAAKLGAKVRAVDKDPVAVRVAAENCALNQVAIPVMSGDLLANLAEPADLIIANILAEVVIELIPQAVAKLKPGGAVLASGIIEQKAAKVRAALASAGFKIVNSLQKEDWVAYLAVWDGKEDA
ncbi:50S ribosomal protein L11 methyltransferase [Capillibacterium thermochitinicola]|uniref:Ribosomal protein L11 methyltransferase n=1 Tax=Capillibacterium thermochitinicola TaxID=2699427 RepID=A0A8J6I163_9FIRM|nr:50S ribosomal protein L11 methyltransferase [Capillibacterium thermochitinicola]MBA2133770.1 50S ribosomal protein L11 methyltransferase [Capillibacterium thermochitinicola]